MLGTFLGLQTALRGLETAQAGVDTVSQNIDNANTPGYSRETVDVSDMPSLLISSSGTAMVGQGSQVTQIQRIQNQFLNAQYQSQNAQLSQATVEQSTLNEVSGIIDEPSDTGISNALEQFYQAWDTLSGDASDLSSRTSVVDAAQTLTQVVNQTANQLSALSSNVSSSLSDSVTQANSLLSQIASVSNQIAAIQQTGGQPNSLLDQRDELLNQLSQYVSFQTQTTTKTVGDVSYDQFSLTLTGMSDPVIDGTQTDFSQSTPPGNLEGNLAISSTGQLEVVPTAQSTLSGTSVLSGQSGEIQGYQNSLADIQSYQNELDVLAQSLAGPGTSTLTSDWTIPGDAADSPPYNTMLVGSSGETLSDYVQSLTPNADGSYTIPSGTTITTTLGAMSVTLDGAMDITSSTPSALDNLQIVLPDGTKTTIGGYGQSQLPEGTTIEGVGLNQLLQLGYSENGPGKALFTTPVTANGQPITASNITVQLEASDLAAGTTVADPSADPPVAVSGDGSLATLIANMTSTTMSFPSPSAPGVPTSSTQLTGTLSDYLTSVVGQLGLQGQQANNAVSTQTSLVQQLTNEQQSVSGVSTDEEMTNMISYQQAYNASAEVISTINDMLTQLMQNV
ncbi:flagellar hook-associated protein FlgK [Alicyclobacillus acidiphilus]|uniref:flagellar hook-associated protein FlgK n=1 Tax=Alicyclobacillus acidiphilus TaxID=182455 RepID=UPI00082CB9EC|nr:flagellar hook-associated protein FlgK [Alicyclobacillus acidiphilus]